MAAEHTITITLEPHSPAEVFPVRLMSFWDAGKLIEKGYGLARIGFTQRGPKWIRLNPGSEIVLSHLELYYHESYPNDFAGRAIPWTPSRCDMLVRDWFIHPLAPSPWALH